MEIIDVKSLTESEDTLCLLLTDCVESGSSVGFLTPVNPQHIRQYWQGIAKDITAQKRQLFVIFEGQKAIASVQLALCSKPNGTHRGEVEKLMVHTEARGQGLSKLPMTHLEQQARALGLQLLVLDTRLGDIASTLYRKMGFQEAGEIPDFTQNANGDLEATVLFYKRL